MIDDQIELKVIDVEGETVKLGIQAPKQISVHRKEIYLSIQKENQSALKLDLDLKELEQLKKN